jgi:Na+/H+-dicarboxylate symporter
MRRLPSDGLLMLARQRLFTAFLVAATLLGVLVGWLCNHSLSAGKAAEVAAGFSIITDAFLRLIKMVIAPLVFASLVSAIAKMGSAAEIGRVGARALLWFLGASCVSLLVGLLMAHWLHPGEALHLQAAIPLSPTAISGNEESVGADAFMTHLIPRSIVEAMADNEILQIVVFSVFIGTAAAALKDKVSKFVELVDQLAAIMFKVTDYVMKAAPLAIFAALASSICVHGIGIVGTYASFVGGFYLSLGILWVLLIAALVWIAGARGMRLIYGIRHTVLLAFAMSSSEAAYPRLLEQLVDFGVPRRIASFVLPLGYSFNLDGAMMYCAFAILFIAQAYGIELTLAQQVALFGLLIVTTKGVAGVPRAAIAVIAVTLHYFRLPDSGIALVLAVDHMLDMGRSATNIVGNAVAAAAVARWEGGPEPAPRRDIV